MKKKKAYHEGTNMVAKVVLESCILQKEVKWSPVKKSIECGLKSDYECGVICYIINIPLR